MADLSPPIISLRPLRGQDAAGAPISEDGRAQETHMEMGKGINDATAVVSKVAASLKKFGCVCVPVSDLDKEEVCWPGHDVDKDPERVVRCRTSCCIYCSSAVSSPPLVVNPFAIQNCRAESRGV